MFRYKKILVAMVMGPGLLVMLFALAVDVITP